MPELTDRECYRRAEELCQKLVEAYEAEPDRKVRRRARRFFTEATTEPKEDRGEEKDG